MEWLKDMIEESLDSNRGLRKVEGSYFGTLEADYRDYIRDKALVDISKSDHPWEAFYELFEGAYDAYAAEEVLIDEVIEEVEDKLERGLEEEEIAFVKDFIYSNVVFEPDYEHYLNQDVLVNILVDTGDGNYEFALNDFAHSYFNPHKDPVHEESSLLWLVRQQGYSESLLNKAFMEEEYFGNKFIESVVRESANVTSRFNSLVFLVKMTLKDFLNLRENPQDPLVLSKDTTCGLVDFWNGGGSLLEIELEKPVCIPADFYSAHIDGARGYGIKKIYKVDSSMWVEQD